MAQPKSSNPFSLNRIPFPDPHFFSFPPPFLFTFKIKTRGPHLFLFIQSSRDNTPPLSPFCLFRRVNRVDPTILPQPIEECRVAPPSPHPARGAHAPGQPSPTPFSLPVAFFPAHFRPIPAISGYVSGPILFLSSPLHPLHMCA